MLPDRERGKDCLLAAADKKKGVKLNLTGVRLFDELSINTHTYISDFFFFFLLLGVPLLSINIFTDQQAVAYTHEKSSQNEQTTVPRR